MQKKSFILYISILLSSLLSSCGTRHEDNLNQMRFLSPKEAFIYPDYTNISIPCNIAPLNFYVLSCREYTLKIVGGNGDTLRMKGRNFVKFKPKQWHRLLQENTGNRIWVYLQGKGADGKDSTQMFYWDIRDSIDPYFTCRLIEPSYQMSNLLQSIEYNLQTAKQRLLFDNRLQGYGCVNCHTFAQTDGSHLVYHVRFNRTGTFIVRDKEIKRVNLKSDRFPQGGVYPAWHPNKNIIAFGTANAYPFVHSKDIVRRTEVFDSIGDLILYDIDRNVIFTDSRMAADTMEETFPYWSWDGKHLYFCQSPNPTRDSTEDDVDFSKKIKYNLVRIAFDEKTNTFGSIDTVVDFNISKGTASFPRLSPDGRFLVFCLSDHGTFPIRHPESDLYLVDMTGSLPDDGNWIPASKHFRMKKMEHVNSQFTESYHTFSSNGKWLMFSSKREDNLYSRPYFTYVDLNGISSKPFLLPQKDPAFYLTFLKSYNVPEFASTPAAISATKAKEISTMPTCEVDSIFIDGKPIEFHRLAPPSNPTAPR